MVPIHSTANSVFTTMQCKLQTASYQPVGKATEEANCRAVFDIFFTMFLQNRLERGRKSLGARRREFPRRDHFRDSNDVDFTKDIAKSLANDANRV